jgi:hypothetical protein
MTRRLRFWDVVAATCGHHWMSAAFTGQALDLGVRDEPAPSKTDRPHGIQVNKAMEMPGRDRQIAGDLGDRPWRAGWSGRM